MSGHTLNFQPRYIEMILDGVKRQTIRALRRDGRIPKPGDTLHLFSGMRTKLCKRLGTGKVVEVFPVRIDFVHRRIHSNGIRLNHGEADAFARLDGFSGEHEMIEWFLDVHGRQPVFEGHCICWRLENA